MAAKYKEIDRVCDEQNGIPVELKLQNPTGRATGSVLLPELANAVHINA